MKLSTYLLPLALLTLGACATDDPEETDEETDTEEPPPEETAFIRAAHFSPDGPPVDIFVNAGDEPAFAGASFGDGTAYAELPVGSYDLQISAAGTAAADAVFTVEGAALEKDISYTAIAHGYLSPPSEVDGGFTVTLLENEVDDIADGLFRVQVVHAAALGAFANVDVWSVGDPSNPVALIPDFPYAAAVTADLPAGAYTVCLDVNDDAACDATFALPELTGGFINLIATNDVAGVPFLVAILEDGTTVRIDASAT